MDVSEGTAEPTSIPGAGSSALLSWGGVMDREEERLRAALNRAAPEVDEDGVMESVVRKGRSLRRRRRLAHGGESWRPWSCSH